MNKDILLFNSEVNERDLIHMKPEKIARINELYRKAKAEGLTEAEVTEQKVLRQEYVSAFKENLRGQLDNISIQEADGSITDLGEKYGRRKGH